MVVDCKSFSETIDRVSQYRMRNLEPLNLKYQNVCVVSSFGNDKSLGTESVDVDFSGSQVSINFNARYILDVLNIINR